MQIENLNELKNKPIPELVKYAEKLGIENILDLKKQEIMVSIIKKLIENNCRVVASGVLEILQDGFGFLRSSEANYLPGLDDIYVSPSQIRKIGLKTGDIIEGEIRLPKDGERYFALLKIIKVNYSEPINLKQRVNFDNLTPLYPEERLVLEIDADKTIDYTARIIDLTVPLL